ncbi:hypothetical protein PDIDSM_3212 [Penicillium digitatum]|nr:hypothetical protein PDIDSM_3212 [Penicillium digitatum]
MDTLGIYVLTFNCARNFVDVDVFADHFFDALPASGAGSSAPDLIFLSLQEIAPIAHSFLGGSYLFPYVDAFRRTVQKASAKKWDQHYVNFLTENTGMTGLMLSRARTPWAKSPGRTQPRSALEFRKWETRARSARLGYVVEGHHLRPWTSLSSQRISLPWRIPVSKEPGLEKNQQRGQAWRELQPSRGRRIGTCGGQSQRFVRAKCLPIPCRDLNYRTANIGPSTWEIEQFPRRNVDLDNPSHYSHLLKKDQLVREMSYGRTFHSLSEASIDSPPTYKYSDAAREAVRRGLDTGDHEWKWSNHRWPSWCDRVLYLDKPWVGEAGKVKPLAYDVLPLFAQSDHRPVALVASVPLRPSSASSNTENIRAVAPFSIDPNWKSKRDLARQREIVVGAVAYLGLTREGNGLLLASLLGLFGAWFVLRSMLEV